MPKDFKELQELLGPMVLAVTQQPNTEQHKAQPRGAVIDFAAHAKRRKAKQ